MAAGEVSERYDHLLRDLQEERAAALARIARTLEELIAQLRAPRRRLPDLADPERATEVRRYGELRSRAKRYRWYLEVQREALGLRQHALLDEIYAIPGPIDSRLRRYG